ncbi:hypothetical protein C8T65DRAFT_589805, partial [Cerioporus squamosus]
PGGGREAWTVVLGSTLALFASAGMINAYVREIPDYYESTLLPSSTPASISLIGPLQLFFPYGFGRLTGCIFDAYGTSVCPLASSACWPRWWCRRTRPTSCYSSRASSSGSGMRSCECPLPAAPSPLLPLCRLADLNEQQVQPVRGCTL